MARILVIDDNPDICTVIGTLLEARGHEVDVSPTRLRRSQQRTARTEDSTIPATDREQNPPD